MISKFKQFIIVESATVDVSHWNAQRGSQMGSNEGGIHTDESGQKHYVKIAKDPEQARQEVASSQIHELMGVNTLKPMLIKKGKRVGTATKWNGDLETKSPKHFETLDHDQAAQITRIHHAAVITKNWDSVGLVHDNVMFHNKTGAAHAVDQGGSFNFRAQGGHKDYGADIGEIKSLRDKDMNRSAAHVFHHTFKNHPDIEKNELTSVHKLNYNDVHEIFKKNGVKDPKAMADTLMKRKELLLKHYGN